MHSDKPINVEEAHRHFAAEGFNRAWDLMSKSDRSPGEDHAMLLLSLASLWHWTQRSDARPRNLGIGCWQASRVFALLGHVATARHFAEACLVHSRGDEPFYLGYAHEALARTESLAGDREKAAEHVRLAKDLASRIADVEARALLERDLESLA